MCTFWINFQILLLTSIFFFFFFWLLALGGSISPVTPIILLHPSSVVTDMICTNLLHIILHNIHKSSMRFFSFPPTSSIQGIPNPLSLGSLTLSSVVNLRCPPDVLNQHILQTITLSRTLSKSNNILMHIKLCGTIRVPLIVHSFFFPCSWFFSEQQVWRRVSWHGAI